MLRYGDQQFELNERMKNQVRHLVWQNLFIQLQHAVGGQFFGYGYAQLREIYIKVVDLGERIQPVSAKNPGDETV